MFKVQPGGSQADKSVIEACDEYNISIFTNIDSFYIKIKLINVFSCKWKGKSEQTSRMSFSDLRGTLNNS